MARQDSHWSHGHLVSRSLLHPCSQRLAWHRTVSHHTSPGMMWLFGWGRAVIFSWQSWMNSLLASQRSLCRLFFIAGSLSILNNDADLIPPLENLPTVVLTGLPMTLLTLFLMHAKAITQDILIKFTVDPVIVPLLHCEGHENQPVLWDFEDMKPRILEVKVDLSLTPISNSPERLWHRRRQIDGLSGLRWTDAWAIWGQRGFIRMKPWRVKEEPSLHFPVNM